MRSYDDIQVKPPKGRSQSSVSSEAQLLTEISSKLDRVIAVLAAQGKEREQQIDILSAAGCESNFIGTVVGLTGGAVRTLQSRRKGKGKGVQSTVEINGSS